MTRMRSERIGFAAGALVIVLGGVVAAMTTPLHLALGSWLAAYLVLVGGVSQCVMSEQRRLTKPFRSSDARRWTLLGCWNVGNILVIVGTLSSLPVSGYLGSILLVAALVLAALGTRRPQHCVPAMAVRLLYLVLAVSIPIGLVLAQARTP